MAFQIDLHSFAPLVSSGGSTQYRSDFLDFSSRLADQLRREAIGRVLTISDDPLRILAHCLLIPRIDQEGNLNWPEFYVDASKHRL